MSDIPDWPYERMVWDMGGHGIMHSMGLDNEHTGLFHLLRVISTCFSELKLENCGKLCECKPIQDNCKILKMMDYVVARNSTSIVEICWVHSFDVVGTNMHRRLHVVVSTWIQYMLYNVTNLYSHKLFAECNKNVDYNKRTKTRQCKLQPASITAIYQVLHTASL